MVPKKPKEIRQIMFPENSPVLKQLLELPNKTKDELRKATRDIEKQKQELEKHIMTDEEHNKYMRMSGIGQVRYIRAKKPNAKGRTIPIKKIKQTIFQSDLSKHGTHPNMTWNNNNISRIEQLKLPATAEDESNNADTTMVKN